MTAQKTPFSGINALPPGDSLSEDGYGFQFGDRYIIDRLLRIGAIGHSHDNHAALDNPTQQPTISVANSGGAIPANQGLYVCYTWLDADGGETAPTDAVSLTTPQTMLDPLDAPLATVDYSAGSLLASSRSYAVTITDGLGGETIIGPSVSVDVQPGNPHAQVQISGLLGVLAASNPNSLPGAGWRLWRQQAGGPWYLVASGTTDTFTDNGVAGDCTVQPPYSSTVGGSYELTVTVPAPPSGTTPQQFAVYGSYDGSFTSPALLGVYPISDAGTPITYTDLTTSNGAPPAMSQSYPGAHQINPDRDMVWALKSPVATHAALGVGSYGDVRVTLDTKHIWAVLNPAGATTAADWTDLIPPPGVQVSGASATAQNWVRLPLAEASFPPNTIADFTNLGPIPFAVWNGIANVGDVTETFDPPADLPLMLTSGDLTQQGSLDDWLMDEAKQVSTAPYLAEWATGPVVGEGRRVRAHWRSLSFVSESGGPFALMLDISGDGSTCMGMWWGGPFTPAGFVFQTKEIWDASFALAADASDTSYRLNGNYKWSVGGGVGNASAGWQTWQPPGIVGEIGHGDVWLELYYEGTVLHGNVYGADPDTGAAPVMSASMDMSGIYVPGSGTGHVAVAMGLVQPDESPGPDFNAYPGVEDIKVVTDQVGLATDFVDAGGGAHLAPSNGLLTTTDPNQTTSFQDPYDQTQVLGDFRETGQMVYGEQGAAWLIDEGGTQQWGRPEVQLTTALVEGVAYTEIDVTALTVAVSVGEMITVPQPGSVFAQPLVLAATAPAAVTDTVIQVTGYNAAGVTSGPFTAPYNFPVNNPVWIGTSGAGHTECIYVLDWATATSGVNSSSDLTNGVRGGYLYPGVADFVATASLNAEVAGSGESWAAGTMKVPMTGSNDPELVLNPVYSYNPLGINYPGDRLAVLAPTDVVTDWIPACEDWTTYAHALESAALPVPGGQLSTMAEFVWVGRPGTHANGDGQWVLTQQYMGPWPPPTDTGSNFLNNPVWWDVRKVGRGSGPSGYGSIPVNPNLYAYKWVAPGQFADGYKFRVRVHHPGGIASSAGAAGQQWTEFPIIGVAVNLTDENNGLVWYGGGWTKKPSDLLFYGDHLPPDRVLPDGTYVMGNTSTQGRVGYPPYEGTVYTDGNNLEFAWVDEIAPSADVWFEIWRDGEIVHAALYNADPATGAQPVGTSVFQEPQATGPYAPGQPGYFGVVANFLNPTVGFADFTVLEAATGEVVATLPGQQTQLEFVGAGVTVAEDAVTPGKTIVTITGGGGPDVDPPDVDPPGSGSGERWWAYAGAGVPPSGTFTGEADGDWAIRESDGQVFQRVSGAWTNQGFSLRGPAGAAGAGGATGPRGTDWFTYTGTGTPAPGTFAGEANGDLAVREADGEIFKRVSGAWVDQGWSLATGGAASPWKAAVADEASLPTGVVPTITTVKVVGHSYAIGYGLSSPTTQRATALLAANYSTTETNNFGVGGAAVSGDHNAQGGWVSVFNDLIPTGAAPYNKQFDLGVVWYSLNDIAELSGAWSATDQTLYKHALRAVISRLAAAHVYDNTDASVSYGGDFAVNSAGTDFGTGPSNEAANTGGPVTISVPSDFPGGTVAVYVMGFTTASSNWTFTVDGVAAGSLDMSTANGVTRNGSNNAFGAVKRFTGLSAGAHTIVATCSVTTFQGWFDSWAIEASTPPYILVPGQFKLSDYSLYSGSPHQPTDTDITALNTATQAVAGEFPSQVRFVDLSSLDHTSDLQSDHVHPTATLHATIAGLMESALPHGGDVAEGDMRVTLNDYKAWIYDSGAWHQLTV